MSECSNDCGSCTEDCSSRKMTKEDFLEPANAYSTVKKVIGVVSGKGGVGKSLVTSYLSVLLRRKGYKTAVLDADITGPSIPRAFGIHEKATASQMGILPAMTAQGTKIMSVNLLLETEDTPVIWRGPVIAGTVKQFWSEVLWEDVDYMFVDMPPGTGDVPLTVFQSLPLDGIIIVTSPQELVSMIVSKAVNMANSMDIPVLGLVENYSYVQCGGCGEKIHIFGESHVEEVAGKFDLQVLAQIPVDPVIARAVDSGKIEELQGNWLDEAAACLEKMVPCKEEEKDMKIAVTTDEQNNIFEHFGRCERFTIYEISGNVLTGKSVLDSNGSGHAALGELLKENEIDVLICGGIGDGAMEILSDAGISVIPGMQGDIDVAVSGYLEGNLAPSSQSVCTHHDGEEHSCSGHCEGGCCS